MSELDYSKIDNVVFGDVNHHDYPDYSDAFIHSADYNGKPMTEEQLDQVDHEFIANWLREQEEYHPFDDEPMWSKEMWGGGIADSH